MPDAQRNSRNRIDRASDRSPALAILRARRHLERYPDDGVVWLRLGSTLNSLARYEEAIQAIENAITHCPESKKWIPIAGMGHVYNNAGDLESAIAWYRKAIEADPDEASSYIFLGTLFVRYGRFNEAEQAHREALQCSKGHIDEAYLNLGFVLRATERFAEAADCFRNAIAIDADYKEAKRALKDVERCLRHLRKVQAKRNT